MTKQDDTALNRRKALARIGGLAVAAYTVPAFTTLSMARASSSASAASPASAASEASAASPASAASEASPASAASEASAASPASAASAASAASDPSGPSRSQTTITADECVAGGGRVVTRSDGVSVCEQG